MPHIVLEAENIYKTYQLPGKRIPVMVNASISVEKGQHIAIIGKSGSGKSTLLHILGGLDNPDKNKDAGIRILGKELNRLSSSARSAVRAKDIGFVFQSYHLLPEMNIVENVMLPARALGRIKASKRERAVKLLTLAGLGDRLTHKPLELSGGEQQRVAIARAMMNSPAIILADEPTGNLDSSTGEQILDMLFGMARHDLPEKTSDASLVMVTHSEAIAARCDKILHLRDGKLAL